MLAGQLYQRGVAVTAIENAFVLAAARRLMRPADALPLGTIRSLAYFLPVIEEVLGLRVSPEYFQHVRRITRTDRPRSVGHPAPLARMMEHQPARLRRGSYCLLVSLPQEHAFGVEDNPLISPPFPIRFSEWVTSDECCWSTLAKRPSKGAGCPAANH